MTIVLHRALVISAAVWLVAGSAAAQAQTFFTRGPDLTASANNNPAFGDWDNDGWPDVQVGAPGFMLALLRNEGGGVFSDHSANVQRHVPPGHRPSHDLFGDYDNDGDLDLLLALGWVTHPHPDGLLRNDRGTFTDVSAAAGLLDTVPAANAIWLDYDRDGHLDLYRGHWSVIDYDEGRETPDLHNTLYRNQGDGTFVDVTRGAGLALPMGRFGGGSAQGMIAGDYDDDGWPDLYVAVIEDRNRLFLNDGHGGFRDATTGDVGDPGLAFGATVGDVDNDGDLDIFQASGGFGSAGAASRSLLLANLGGGYFADVTESVGLGNLKASQVQGPSLADIDNDGDLDLVTAEPYLLYLNDGEGVFVEATSRSGITPPPSDYYTTAVGDYDLDGFLDLWGGTLYRNNGNANHYLRVELVGAQSNRGGVGATLVAVAGELRQRRDLLAGNGLTQDEPVVHFGLGQRTRVDRLEVRWPSGRADVHGDIAADQRIRVFEGHNGYHVVEPTLWTAALPDSLVAGSAVPLQIAVRPALFAPGARVTGAVADLSALGGPAAEPLQQAGDGTWRLVLPSVSAGDSTELRNVSVLIDQDTFVGPRWTRLSRAVAVVPAGDLVFADEGVAAGWQVSATGGAEVPVASADGPVHTGTAALAVSASPASFIGWNVGLTAPRPLRRFGYTHLRCAVHPGTASGTSLVLSVGSFSVGLVVGRGASLVDLSRKEWQTVEVPLSGAVVGSRVGLRAETGTFGEVQISGDLKGTFYLDDLRLVAARPSTAPGTAVLEHQASATPQSLSLSPNYPNPFNSSTVIRFALPVRSPVELAVYNLAGQRVVTLVQGERHAGTHTVTWDGRDVQGRPLATGVYLYRLRAGDQAEYRRLLLLR
ncbi:MAG: FG-GAP-like repeat-containing protein [Candidatus Latescibacterota bacterium]